MIGLVSIAILIGAFYAFNAYIYHEKQADVAVDTGAQTAVDMDTYTVSEAGLTFAYPGGMDGYTLTELPPGEGDPAPVRALRILPTTDYVAEQGRQGEGSPAWMLLVYDNTDKLQSSVWADRFPSVSNIRMAIGTPSEAVVGGAKAISYRIDGLYPTNVYVVAHGGYIFVASASFLDETSRTYLDLETWIDSFTFVPTSTRSTGKIDPRVACESALAYMTYSTGHEAEAFIEACVAGDHPEVIERYVESLNLDKAAI
jgi:hypothetical protein